VPFYTVAIPKFLVSKLQLRNASPGNSASPFCGIFESTEQVWPFFEVVGFVMPYVGVGTIECLAHFMELDFFYL